MRMTVCAGVIALVALSLLSIVPSARAADMMDSAAPAHTATIDVARIKSALHLTPAQEPYWAPVESALRELARRQERDAARIVGNDDADFKTTSASFFQRIPGNVEGSAGVQQIPFRQRPGECIRGQGRRDSSRNPLT